MTVLHTQSAVVSADLRQRMRARVLRIPIWQALRAPERKRLDAALGVFGAQLHATTLAASAGETWAQATLELFARAEHEALAGDLDSGWKYLHEAQRQAVCGLSELAVASALLSVTREAHSKLTGWRQAAVRDLLSQLDETSPLELRRSVLSTAMRIRDEHSDNVYYRHRLLRRQMTVVGIVLMLLGCGFFAVLHVRPVVAIPLTNGQPITVSTLLAALTMGGMGACFSALTTFATSSAEMSIPGHLANVAITMTRPLIGAVSGIVAVLLLHSGVVDFGRFSLLVPFAFGFSERLVMGVLAKVAPATPK
jgi:hypothetical protein